MALDPSTDPVYLHGITEVGEWTSTSATGNANEYNDDNVYTETSWGRTGEEGARVTGSTDVQELFSGQSAAAVDSFILRASVSVELELITANLLTLRRLMGLPASAHTGDLSAGTPTAETLRLIGASLGTVEQRLYVKTPGPIGLRTMYFPRGKVTTFPEVAASRTDYFTPNATFQTYEDPQGDFGWITDLEA